MENNLNVYLEFLLSKSVAGKLCRQIIPIPLLSIKPIQIVYKKCLFYRCWATDRPDRLSLQCESPMEIPLQPNKTVPWP